MLDRKWICSYQMKKISMKRRKWQNIWLARLCPKSGKSIFCYLFFNFVSPALSCLLDPRQFQSTQLNIFSRISTESMQLSCQLALFCHNYGTVLVKTSLLTTLTFLTLLPINHIFNSATWTSKTYGHILKIKLNPGKTIVRFPNPSQSKSQSSTSTLALPIFTAPQWLCNVARTKIVALFVFQWNFKNRFSQIFHVHKDNIFRINLLN